METFEEKIEVIKACDIVCITALVDERFRFEFTNGPDIRLDRAEIQLALNTDGVHAGNYEMMKLALLQ